MQAGAIPICLVTGFLGSGKTTLLQRLVVQLHGRRVAYLVNEFSPVDVDGRLLDLPDDALVSLPGGSIFCRCLVLSFIRALQQLHQMNPEGVVIEASGVADPSVIHKMLQETGLDAQFTIARVITLVDPGTYHKLASIMTAVPAQVRAADLVLINKSDLYPDDVMEQVTTAVRRENPTAQIAVTCRADVPIDPFVPQSVPVTEGDYAACADPRFTRFEPTAPRPVNLAALRSDVRSIRESIYRLKGLINTADGALLVEIAGDHWTETPVPAQADNTLVIIANGSDPESARALANRFASGAYSA